MTELLLQKLEENMMQLLEERERSRMEVQKLISENITLKHDIDKHISDSQRYTKKLEEMLLLVEAVNNNELTVSPMANADKLVVVQG